MVAFSLFLDPHALAQQQAFPSGHAVSVWERLTMPGFLVDLYPGLLLLPLAWIGWRRGGLPRAPLLTLLLLGLGLAWAIPPFDLMRLLPMLGKVAPRYAAPLLLVPIALLAGAGLGVIAREGRKVLWWIVPWVLPAALWHLWQLRTTLRLLWPDPGALYLAAAALGMVLVVVLLLRPEQRILTLLGLVLVDLFLHAHPHCKASTPFDYPETKVIRAIRQTVGEEGRLVAVTPIPNLLPPNAAVAYDLEDVRMIGAVTLRRHRQLLSSLERREPYPTFTLTERVASPLWDLLGVRAVLTHPREPVPEHYRLVYANPFIRVWENPRALSRVFVPGRIETVPAQEESLEWMVPRIRGGLRWNPMEEAVLEWKGGGRTTLLEAGARGSARIVQREPERVVVEADMERAGLLVLANSYAEGWTVEVDGVPAEVQPVDHVVMGVRLAPGRHEVVFRYGVSHLWLIRILFLTGAAMTGLCVLDTFRRKWRKGVPRPGEDPGG
jgi:hypothetical protein